MMPKSHQEGKKNGDMEENQKSKGNLPEKSSSPPATERWFGFSMLFLLSKEHEGTSLNKVPLLCGFFVIGDHNRKSVWQTPEAYFCFLFKQVIFHNFTSMTCSLPPVVFLKEGLKFYFVTSFEFLYLMAKNEIVFFEINHKTESVQY